MWGMDGTAQCPGVLVSTRPNLTIPTLGQCAGMSPDQGGACTAIIPRMHLADGAPYPSSYAEVPSGVQAIAVGWLDASHPFTVGRPDEEFVLRLFEGCRSHATARTRGWHRCELCLAQGE